MKVKYNDPQIEIIVFDTEDVITDSLLSSDVELQPQ